MINQTMYKVATINPVMIKIAVIIALLVLSLVAPDVAFAGPSRGATGG